jgi:CelD/BcsL family acetyltransferase involved in cellulose biosynthesis
MTVMAARDLKAADRSRAGGFRVDIVRDWNQAVLRWPDQRAGTPFQDFRWLDTWYRAFGRSAAAEPLLAIITNAATSEPVALLPLVRRLHNGIRRVEFADLALTDYNAPILAPGAPSDAAGARALCRALIAALRRLPDGADLLRMQKLPARLAGQPNPLVVLGRDGSCSLNGNLIEIGDDFETYRSAIKRMKLSKSWRVFNRYSGATFRLLDNADEARALLDTMDAQQQARMQCLGLSFNLNDGPRAKFYRDLVSRGLEDGYVVVAALSCDEGTVATTLGIRQGAGFVFLRSSNAGRRWSHCSPSRLVIERTMAALHERGVRQFDLSIGNYAFKRRFGAAALPLTDVSVALSWRGIPYALRDRAAQELRRYPWLAERVGRALGRPEAREE